ncbi:MAG: NACHT domain-containing protein, partial [Solirubrobacteraceae bacterium]
PDSLFPTSPGKPGDVLGRRNLVEEIATSLRHDYRTGPVLVVGDTGSGKTSLLLALADYFAQQNVLPIVVPLHGVTDIDFFELAHNRFKEYIDPYVRTDQDADKLWRWMCRRGDIVVLADDLDRMQAGAVADPYKTQARVALEAAARRELPLVVTSRPRGLPTDMNFPPVTIGALELKPQEAADRVLERVAHRPGAETNVREAIERGQLVTNPFYLGVILDLLRMHRLDAPKHSVDSGPIPRTGGVHAVRVALLRSLTEGLVGGESLPEEERKQRQGFLAYVARFAARSLAPGQKPEVADPVSPELRSLRAGEQFGLLEVDESGTYRFKHEVMHAYLASRVIDDWPTAAGVCAGEKDADPLIQAVVAAPGAPRVQLAAAFAAAASEEPSFCRRVCELLLHTHDPTSDERLLLRAVAAAEVATAGEFHELDEEIAQVCMDSRRAATSVGRLTAVEHLAELSGVHAVRALWDYAGDDDYDVRFNATQRLVTRCSSRAPSGRGLDPQVHVSGTYAFKVLCSVIEPCLKQAENLRLPQDDWTQEIIPLKHMAFMLPALRTVTASARCESATAQECLCRLLDLEKRPVTNQKGLEASVAQGFKADAQLHKTAGIDQDAIDLLKRAEFWYSQINLLQAITVRAAYAGGLPDNREQPSDYLAELNTNEPHPYLKAAAKLCDRGYEKAIATREPSSVDAYVWEDEGKLVSRRPVEVGEDSGEPGGLVSAAIQLVGDIVVLLNLNENGDEDQRDVFGRCTKLPYCMYKSSDRSELFGSCNGHGCTFHLCPYQPPVNRLSAHREISRAFCRHQSLRATEKAAQLWESGVKTRRLRESWRELELRARV